MFHINLACESSAPPNENIGQKRCNNRIKAVILKLTAVMTAID